MLRGGEERAEQLRYDRFGNARSAIDHVDDRRVFDFVDIERDPRGLAGQVAMASRVLHQGRDDLMQMLRIDQRRHVRKRCAQGDVVGFVRNCLFEFVDERAQQRNQFDVLGSGAFAPREAEHAFDDAVGAHALLMDDLHHPPIAFDDVVRFFEQLRGIADRGQRVADLVG